MELIQLTTENIEQYLDDCCSLQAQLVKHGEVVEPQRFREVVKESHNYFVGVVIDGHVVALGEITKIVHPVRTVGYINNIVVDGAQRGKGLFTVIMDALEVHAVQWGCRKLNLTCSREEVWPLYEKRGYTERQTRFYTKGIE